MKKFFAFLFGTFYLVFVLGMLYAFIWFFGKLAIWIMDLFPKDEMVITVVIALQPLFWIFILCFFQNKSFIEVIEYCTRSENKFESIFFLLCWGCALFVTVGHNSLTRHWIDILVQNKNEATILGLSSAFYFLPSIISKIRNHHNSLAIYFLNTFLGWTIMKYMR